MKAQFIRAALMACLAISVASPAVAQQAPADVTFNLPLNLTRLHAQITEIKLYCRIDSSALGPSQGAERFPTGRRFAELIIPVSQGEVVQTVQVVIPLNGSDFVANASGSTANYECVLFARYPSSQQPWVQFGQGGSSAYQLTPVPAPITGSFVW